MRTQRKVPAGPKAQPGGKGKGAKSAVKVSVPTGIDPANLGYGIKNTTRNHKSAVAQPTSYSTPSAQGTLARKAPRQVG